MTEVVFLSSSEVVDLAEPAEYVDVVRDAYRQRGEGAPAKPRTTLLPSHQTGMLTSYLAILPETGYMGGYTYAAGFGDRDAWFITPLFDATSGELVALLDGAAMNPYKTGAAGAVGVDALAREDARILGVFGSSAQARGQLLATATVRDLDEVRVYSPTPENRRLFAEEMDDVIGPSVVAVDDPEAVLANCDIVITATRATDPVFDGDRLEPGTHVTAMGQYHPDRREIDGRTVARSVYVPDLADRALQDAGAFLHAVAAGTIDEDHIHAELGDVVAGTKPGRTDENDITVFDSGGTAIETVAAAGLLYERALDRERGTTLSLSPASEAFPGR